MRVTLLALVALVSTSLGCASKPIFVQLSVDGPSQASAEIRNIGAETDPAPLSCETPCRIEFAPKSVLDLELRADGFYPARLAVEYWVMDQYKRVHDQEEPSLVIPMVRRPSP